MVLRITFDPHLMGGRACIRGMRITEYPDLEPDDIREALQYTASLANEEVHPLSSSRS